MPDSLQPLPLVSQPKHYFCAKAERPVTISGRIDDPQWALAGWTDDFVDILGPEAAKPLYRTRVKMLWDEEHLYIAAELEEPHVWATLTDHDSVIFYDNDFEVFIDPDGDCHHYAELEINALNTTWDLLLTKPYRARGKAINGWEIKGLRTAVHVDGTINDPENHDRGWTVEIAIPWEALDEISDTDLPPTPGDHIRINFSRVQWEHEIVDGEYRKIEKPEDNWVWSPQNVVDMHRPHRWGFLQFVDNAPAEAVNVATESATLSALLEAQLEYRSTNGRWARSTVELNLTEIEGLSIESTSAYLEMRLGDWAIDQDSRLRRVTL